MLVHLDLRSEAESEDPREFEELALSAGADPLVLVTGKRDTPHARYFVGTGKLELLTDNYEGKRYNLEHFNDKSDFATFLAQLTIFNWKRKNIK